MSSGRLVLVVGPSGVGKDSILHGVRQHYADNPAVVFPRRVITREVVPGTEDHDTLDIGAFEAERARGAFALSWQAHGLWYGVPSSVEADVRRGRIVIVNTSRTIIDETMAKYPGTQVVQITASKATLEHRLKNRGRETEVEVSARLARAIDIREGEGIWTISNDGTLEEAVAGFISILKRFQIP